MRTQKTRALIISLTLIASTSLTACGTGTPAPSGGSGTFASDPSAAPTPSDSTKLGDTAKKAAKDLLDKAKAAIGTSGSATATTDQPTGTLPVGSSASPMPAPGTCTIQHAADGSDLPDPKCTPGAINPAVRQDNIDSTICTKGYTATIRPSTSITNKMKAESARSYSLSSGEKGEYDHLLSLELGGAPDDPRNLWVEPGAIPNPKDSKAENPLHDLVCAHKVPLAVAQQLIATDWTTALAKAQAYKG